jgi:protein gp37
MYDLRIPILMQIPVAKRFVSAEPLLGPIDLRLDWIAPIQPDFPPQTADLIDWVIVGGESGPNFRVMKEEWATDLRDQCMAAGVPFFFKQWSAYRPKKDPRGMMLDGELWVERPRAVGE